VRSLPARIIEIVAPARLGRSFRWLLSASFINNVGDGVAIVGGMVIGTPLGGVLAKAFGITAPFWFAFAGSALLVAILWRQFDHIVHASKT
jgi:cystathionine beta-lyase family protein involved in aluminum resistance